MIDQPGVWTLLRWKKHLTPRGNIIFHISKSPHVFTVPLCLWHHRHAQRSTCSKQALGRKPGFLGARLKRHLLRLGGVRGETKRVVDVTWWIYYIVSCCIISWYYTILYYTIRCYTILHYTIPVYVIYCIICYIKVILLYIELYIKSYMYNTLKCIIS